MTREHWRRITAIFHAALTRKTGDRDAFVAEQCGLDPGLQRDVAAMLSAHAEAGLDQTAAIAARLALDAASGGGVNRDGTVSTADRPTTATGPSSAPTTPLFAPGDLVAGRYRVAGLIGRGGMGEVYEARDEVVDDVVALKVARHGPEPAEQVAARWRRELLLARKISHASVCRVHDVAIHREGDHELPVLTMERVKGESLRARLRRRPVPLDKAFAIAGQIAHALAAAHAAGVLHRDVKPENILLEPGGSGGIRAVLTDFGIARDASGAESLTRTGQVTGTAGYLAPEVLRGRPPSPRSDLYAFAVVVRGLLEGTTAPLTPRALAVFERALSAEWATRYESPVRFIDDLAAAQRPQPLEPPRRWTRRHTLAAAAVVAIVASAAAALWSSRQATTSIAPASEVLLTDLVNGTADPELDGAGEVMRSQLAQSPHFELLPRDRVRASLARMGRGDGGTSAPEVAREIALREGVPLVVFTALTRLGADYTLSVKLEQVGARPTFARRTWTRSFAAPTRAALFEAMHLAAVWIRQMAGELPADLDQQDRAASDTTTSSWEALRLFAQAADLQAAGRVHDATLVLEQAVRIDPDFAMAHTRLGDYLIGLRRDQEGFAAWQQALAAAERRQLTSRETLRLRAQYLDDTGDLAGAEKAFRTYAVHYPNDFHAAFFVGASLKEVNRLAEAVPWLERALTLRPQSAVGAVHLAVAYLDLERGADAARAIDHVESLGASEWSTWLRALSLFAAVKPVDALAALEPLAASADPQWRSRAHVIRASWLSEVGQDEEALTELRAGIAHDTAHGLRDRLADKWLHFAELQGRVQDPGASSSVHLALETASNARRLQRAVGILARAGHRADAERLMARFDALPPIPLAAAARDRAQGELALGGDVRGAVTAFERALANTRRWENLLPFAEALAKAGDLARAESVLRITADHPAMIYAGSEPQSPGLWRQSLARLADLVERRDPSAAAGIRQRFAKIILQPVPSATR